MTVYVSRGVQKSLQVSGTILGLAGILGLLHCGRFSAYQYDTLNQEEILPSLIKNVFKENYSACSIDLKSLESMDIISVLELNRNQSDEHVAQHYNVQPGGSWAPSHCSPSVRVFLVIPYRDREKHLNQFLRIIHPFLQAQNISYTILVVEQVSGESFNRAKLFNIGYQELKKMFGSLGCIIFHDVDLIPLDGRNLYGCVNGPRALHLSAHLDNFRYNLPYERLFGGAVAVEENIFEDVNGFSNLFYGWGGEDDDFSNRLHSNGYSIVRYSPTISRYTMLPHVKETPTLRNKVVQSSEETVEQQDDDNNGVRQLDYSVTELNEKSLYTHIIVKL